LIARRGSVGSDCPRSHATCTVKIHALTTAADVKPDDVSRAQRRIC
jgi:hypothetical protein